MINYLNLNGIKTFLNKMRGEFLSKSDAASIYLKKSDAVSSGNAVTGGKQVEGGFALTNAAGEVVCTIPAAAFKANPNLSLSQNSISNSGGASGSFSVTHDGDGIVSAVSDSDNLAVTVSDTTIFWTAQNADFNANIAVTVSESLQYRAATVNVPFTNSFRNKKTQVVTVEPSSYSGYDFGGIHGTFTVTRLGNGAISAADPDNRIYNSAD